MTRFGDGSIGSGNIGNPLFGQTAIVFNATVTVASSLARRSLARRAVSASAVLTPAIAPRQSIARLLALGAVLSPSVATRRGSPRALPASLTVSPALSRYYKALRSIPGAAAFTPALTRQQLAKRAFSGGITVTPTFAKGTVAQGRSLPVNLVIGGGKGATYKDAVLADNPVSYWRLGDNVTIHDEMGVSADAVAAGGWTDVGLLTGDTDASILFDGADDAVEFPNIAAHNVSSGSLEIWMKSIESGVGGSYRALICKTEAWGIFMLDNQLMTYDWGGGGNQLTGVFLNDNVRHHVVLIFQSGVAGGSRFYVDGVAVGSPFQITILDPAEPLTIAKNSNTQFFRGNLDEAALYNSILSPARILAHYQTGTGAGGSSNAPGMDLRMGFQRGQLISLTPVMARRVTAQRLMAQALLITPTFAPRMLLKRVMAVTATLTAAMARARFSTRSFPLGITFVPTAQAVKSRFLLMTVPVTFSFTLVRRIGKRMDYAFGITPVLNRLYFLKRPMIAGITLTATISRASKRLQTLAGNITFTPAVAVKKFQSFVHAATATLNPVMTRRYLAKRTLNAAMITTPAIQYVKSAAGGTFAVAINFTNTLAQRKFFLRTLAGNLAMTPVLARRAFRRQFFAAGINFTNELRIRVGYSVKLAFLLVPNVRKSISQTFSRVITLISDMQWERAYRDIVFGVVIDFTAGLSLFRQRFKDYATRIGIGAANLLRAAMPGSVLHSGDIEASEMTMGDETPDLRIGMEEPPNLKGGM